MPKRHLLQRVCIFTVLLLCTLSCLTLITTDIVSAQGGGADSGGGAVVTPTAVAPCLEGQKCSEPTFKFLHDFVLSIGGGFAGIFGSVFDLFIDYFIIRFGEQYNTTNLGIVINGTWGTVRDIFNLTFIFGLVYIGFQIILGNNDSEAKRTIPLLVMAALLINFSLFIVKFVIDFANIAAVQVYGLFQSVNAVGAESPEVGVSISLAFMNALGVSALLDSLPASGELLYIFGMLAVFLVLAYVFLAGAVLIAIRFAVLCMLMVFAPVMFIGWVFPGFSKYSHEYWSKLLNQAFFAPIFLFMLYLSYVVISTFNDERTGGEIRGAFSNVQNYNGSETVATTFLTVMPFFVMTIVFLLASMHIAKKMGAQGADWTANFAKKWSGLGLGMAMAKAAPGAIANTATYPVKAGSRYLVNAGGEKLEKKFNDLQTRDGALGAIARTNFVDRRARAATGGLTKAELGTGTYNKAEKEYKKGVKKQAAATKSDNSLADAIKTGAGSTNSDQIIAMESAVQNANQEQLIKALDKASEDPAKYESVVKAMSTSQVAKLLDLKDDEFNADKRNNLYTTRQKMIKEKVEILGRDPVTNVVSLTSGITKANTDDLNALGFDVLKANALHIPAAKMDDLKGKLTQTQYDVLNDKRTDDLKTLFRTSPGSVFNGKSDTEIARLPKEILTARSGPGANDPLLVESYLNANILKQMVQGKSGEEYVKKPERAIIRQALENTPTTTPELLRMVDWLDTPLGQGF